MEIKQKIDNRFSRFATFTCELAGSFWSFLAGFFLIIIWIIAGPFFHYSDTWQLVINTSTTIITFLMVFLIQYTQNRDTKIINLKLDELIYSHRSARNSSIDLGKLTDEELNHLEEEYKKICEKRGKKAPTKEGG